MRTPPLLLALAVLVAGCAAPSPEANIKEAIAAANYCEVASDCMDAGSKCPFGCNTFVNAKEKDRIASMIDEYPSDCVYSCIAINGVECNANKCEAIIDGPPAQEEENPEGNVGVSCTSSDQCDTPMGYLIRSSCPFTSMCVDGSCAVVCPMHNPDPNADVSKTYEVSCSTDSDCSCTGMAADKSSCRCVEDRCVAVMK